MKKYLLRSVKYFIAFCVVYVAFMALAHYTDHLPVTFAERWQLMFATWRGWGMVVGIILLAATYPFFGFAKRSFEADIVADHEQLDMAAEVVGLRLVSASESELVYRADGLRRLMRLFEDEVRVRQNGNQVEVDGLRSYSVRMAYDAERYITNKHRRERGEI
ncbi:MAG: hypothetical protein IKA07_04140 [Alistipes sp.]|nr:hypothetical protein [Alistipes sp.]